MAKALRIGGFVSGAILIVFGVVVIALAINARSTVTDNLQDEKIVGSADMNPSAIEAAMKEAGLTGVDAPSLRRCDEQIATGSEASASPSTCGLCARGVGWADLRRDGALRDRGRHAKGTNDAEQPRRSTSGSRFELRPQLGDADRARDIAQRQLHGRAVVAVQPRRSNRIASRRCRLHRARLRRNTTTAIRSVCGNRHRIAPRQPICPGGVARGVARGGQLRHHRHPEPLT